MKRISTHVVSWILSVCLLIANTVSAQSVTIGTATNTQRYPLGNFYGYERSASIYLASEIGRAGSIERLAWNATVSGTTRPIKIYLQTTTATTLSTSSWADEIASATLVYDGSLAPSADWNTINLSTAFSYNGTDNLLVLVEANYGGSGVTVSEGNAVQYTTAASQHEYWQQDYSEPTDDGTVTDDRPNIQIGFPLSSCSGTPEAGTIAFSPTTLSPGSTYTVTSSGYTLANSLLFIWQKNVNNTGWMTSGPATSTYTSWQDTAEVFGAVTQHRLIVLCGISGGMDTSNIVTFTSNYCTPAQGSSTYYFINSITTSGTVADINYSTASYQAYTDSSSVQCVQYPGGTISVSINAGTAYYYMWIDWNQDGDFDDAGETVINTTSTSDSYSGSFIVPDTLLAGNYRVRFASSYYNDNAGPCDDTYYGTYVDYTLNVLPQLSCLYPSGLTLSSIGRTSAGVNWTAPSSGDAVQSYNWELRTSGNGGSGATGLVSSNNQTNTVWTSASLVPGTNYTFYVQSNCGGNDSSYWLSIAFTTPVYEPINITSMNADVIANGAGPSNQAALSTTNSVDDPTPNASANYAYISSDFSRDHGTTTWPLGLPNNRIIEVGTKYWKLSDYSGNNVLKLAEQDATDTLKFFTPRAAKNIYVLAVSGSGASTVDFSVLFNDGTTADFTDVSVADWYGSGAILQTMRVSRDGGSPEQGSNGPNLYETVLDIDATDTSKTITGIKVTKTNETGTGFLDVFAVSINPSATACDIPTVLASQNITDASASISWTGTSTSYQLSYGINLGNPDTGTIVNNAVSAYSLSGLAANTAYNVYIRGICGSDTSYWAGPLSFTTLMLPCTSVSAGTVTTSATSVCSYTEFTLTAPMATVGTAGITYQWQSSPSGTNVWQNIAGATATTYYASNQTEASDYRLYIVCSGGNSDTSVAIPVAQNPATMCYCIPVQGDDTYYYLNSLNTTGAVTNIDYSASSYNAYVDSSTSQFSQYQGQSIRVNMEADYSEFLCWIDWNQDGNLDDGENVFTSDYEYSYSAVISIPYGQTPGNYRVRFAANSDDPTPACGPANYGNYVDYTLVVLPLVTCSGTPTAGTVSVSPAQDASGATYGASATGYSIATSLSFQWQSNTDNAGWVSAGASDTVYSDLNGLVAGNFGSTAQYRLIVTCNVSGESDTSSVATFTSGYCLPTSTIDDESGITSVSLTGLGTALNNTSDGDPGYSDYTNIPVTVYIGQTYTLSVEVDDPSYYYGVYAKAWIDWNQNGDFSDDNSELDLGDSQGPGTTYNSPLSVIIPPVTPGAYRVRIRATREIDDDYNDQEPTPCGDQDYSEAEDYILNIVPVPVCSGTPTAGTISVSPVQNGAGTTYDAMATDYSIATNLSFQWQSNTNNAGWVSAGTSDNVYSDLNGLVAGSLGSTTQYRLIVTCTVSNESDTSNVATFTSGYCTPNGTDGGSYIDNFTTTGGVTNVDNSSDYSNAGYGNYTTDTITQVVSSAINFSIDITGGTVGAAIWGDWNHDGTFDASEQVYVTDGYDYGPFTGSFDIPAGATIGATSLRVLIDFNNPSPDDPCSFGSGRGEIEDYTIVVQAAEVPAPTISSFTPANGCANASTVVITGTNFTNATSVTIGGTAVSSFTVNSSTQITASVGIGTSGVIRVTTASGTATTTAVFTVNTPATTTQSFTLCPGETVTVGSHTYSASGTYHDTLQTNTGGCDSIVITTVNSNNAINTSVSVVGVTATVATSNATYQWINCTSGQAVAGATAQSFTAAVSDNYKVAVTLNSCSDTSDCVNLVADTTHTGIKDVDWAKAISVYPNPTTGVATIAITNFNASDLIITITDIQGQLVFQSEENVHSSNYSTTINLSNAAKGVYLVKLNTGNSFAVKQLILQ